MLITVLCIIDSALTFARLLIGEISSRFECLSFCERLSPFRRFVKLNGFEGVVDLHPDVCSRTFQRPKLCGPYGLLYSYQE